MTVGLSMQELANRAGVAIGTISRAESGHDVWPETLHRIAGGLGCAVTELMAPEGSDAG